jgi:hypothetical protein
VRFNFLPTTPDLRRADRLPLKIGGAAWSIPVREDAVVTYVGEGSIGVDASSIDLPPSYEREASVGFTLPPGRHVMRVYYTFDDGSTTSDRRNRGPFATIHVMTVRGDGSVGGPLAAAQPAHPRRGSTARRARARHIARSARALRVAVTVSAPACRDRRARVCRGVRQRVALRPRGRDWRDIRRLVAARDRARPQSFGSSPARLRTTRATFSPPTSRWGW